MENLIVKKLIKKLKQTAQKYALDMWSKVYENHVIWKSSNPESNMKSMKYWINGCSVYRTLKLLSNE